MNSNSANPTRAPCRSVIFAFGHQSGNRCLEVITPATCSTMLSPASSHTSTRRSRGSNRPTRETGVKPASFQKACCNLTAGSHRQSAAHYVDGSFAAAFRRNLVGLRAATWTRRLHGLLVERDSRRIVVAAVRKRIAPHYG